jgi:methionyl-tRNA formyltransferase
MTTNKQLNFAFFGTPEFSTIILDELESAGYVPHLIICSEDKPVGRKLIITPPPTKIWAEKRNIKVIQPKSLREERNPGITEIVKHIATEVSNAPWDLFIVAAYGKIIPQAILDIPKHGTLNVHPSLLPRLRGPSPIENAILTEDETGMSIMVLDADMDHGPILAQEKTMTSQWPEYADVLEHTLAHQGGKMLAGVIDGWVANTLKGIEQDHSKATITKKITKEDGLLDLKESPEKNLRKIRAFCVWPRAYFLTLPKRNGGDTETQTRIIVTKARIEDNKLILERVIPEGKKEMSYVDWQRGLK